MKTKKVFCILLLILLMNTLIMSVTTETDVDGKSDTEDSIEYDTIIYSEDFILYLNIDTIYI